MFGKDTPKSFTAMLYAAFGFSSFAIGDAAYKWLAQFHSVAISAFYGALVAFVILMIFQKPLGGVQNLAKSPFLKWQLLRGSLIIGQFFFLILAMKTMSMASIYTIVFCAPLIATLLARLLFKDAFDLTHLGIILLGFVGVVIALNPQDIELGLGQIYAFLSACFLALANITSRKINADEDIPLSFTIYGVVGTLILSPFLAGFSLPFPPLSHVPIFMIAALGGSIGMYCLGLAFSKGSTSVVAPFNYIQLVWGILFGALIFGDPPHLHTLIGAAFVIAAGFILIAVESRSRKI